MRGPCLFAQWSLNSSSESLTLRFAKTVMRINSSVDMVTIAGVVANVAAQVVWLGWGYRVDDASLPAGTLIGVHPTLAACTIQCACSGLTILNY